MLDLVIKLKKLCNTLFGVKTNTIVSGIQVNGKGNSINVQVNSPQNAEPKKNIELSALENKILTILAEGGHAAIARDETGVIMQINLYSHPQQDSVDPVSPETLKTYQSLLRKGFVSECFNGSCQEYVISSRGRDFLLRQ